MLWLHAIGFITGFPASLYLFDMQPAMSVNAFILIMLFIAQDILSQETMGADIVKFVCCSFDINSERFPKCCGF